MENLIILVADKDTEQLLQGLLQRVPTVQNINSFSFKILKHPQRDGGVRTDAANFLRNYANIDSKLLVIFDYEGSGADTKKNVISPQQLTQDIENQLVGNGWLQNDVCVCVINPELENWIWVADNSLCDAVGTKWTEQITIREWLQTEAIDKDTQAHFTIDTQTQKPISPKKAFELFIDKQGKVYSSALFKKIGEKVGYTKCQDPAFLKMLNSLVAWFQKT